MSSSPSLLLWRAYRQTRVHNFYFLKWVNRTYASQLPIRRIFSSIYFSNASIIRHRKIGLQEDDYKTRGKWDVILRNRWNRWLSSISWLCAITMRTTDMRYASAILLKIFPAAGSASESEKHLHCTVELGWWHTFLSTSNLSWFRPSSKNICMYTHTGWSVLLANGVIII